MDIQDTQTMSNTDKNQGSWKPRYWAPMTEEMMEDDVDIDYLLKKTRERNAAKAKEEQDKKDKDK